MSASLVGSEMCIRDRPRRQSTCKFRPDEMRPLLGFMPGWARTVLTAVSYTHLTLPTICSV
eukprot:1897485-Alexandrium_andersonii.AAC.1